MRKYIILFAAVILLLTKATAQSVGINNNTPHASAALDVTSTTKGVLIPRLTQAQRLAIASPAKGLLVFDSTSNSFWYRTGAAWQEIGAATDAWKLTGNSGTDTAVNFLGTTDGAPLLFKVSNGLSGIIDFTNANTGFGYQSLHVNKGTNNSAFGFNALYSNTTGGNNTAHGYGTLYSNTTGSNNVAIGQGSLVFNNASGNTATGFASLYSNLSGSYNTAAGYGSLLSNQTGSSNVAIGVGSLYTNTSRSNLVAIGDSALYNNGTGASLSSDATANTAVGSKALYANTTGNSNTANGYQALYSNTAGFANIANGLQALYSNTIGAYNTANGYGALYANTSGYSNTAIGSNALSSNTTGINNTSNGFYALSDNTTGPYNTANGGYALSSNTSGNTNTGLGYNADVSTGNLSNATVIGANATVNTSNKVRIGDANVTVIEGQVDWSFPSDGRFKTNISETVKGLEFIMKLRPIVYNFQTKKYAEFIRGEMLSKAKFTSQQDFSKSEGIRHSGFVAQEVEQAAKEAGYDFNGIIVPENDKQTYSLSYAQFVVPLVKAVQELSKKNDELEKRLAKLESLLAAQSK